ncbi:MAG: hypothetical protein CL434_14195 [Acidimicrobiaceae bacterium]|nr:hypothetical protein [Acidimicrobiaceae bacterium]
MAQVQAPRVVRLELNGQGVVVVPVAQTEVEYAPRLGLTVLAEEVDEVPRRILAQDGAVHLA